MWFNISFWWKDYDKAVNIWKSVSSAVQLALTDIALLVQNSAKINAPYLTGNLRWSISTDFNKIQQWIAIVWSPVAYARRREYENFAHPDRRYYLHRAWTDNEWQINNIVKNDLSKALK